VQEKLKRIKKMKTSKINLEGNKIVSADLHVVFYQDSEDGDIVIARCNALNLATHGDNLTHAMKMFDDCVSLWVETINDYNEAKEALKELGWEINQDVAVYRASINHEINEIKKDYKIDNIPVHIIGNKSLSISLPVWSN
jgi:predicted RNase H-like HicB family nuclease